MEGPVMAGALAGGCRLADGTERHGLRWLAVRRGLRTAQPPREIRGTGTGIGSNVGRVGQRTTAQREAAAADARIQAVTQRRQGAYLVVEPPAPAPGEPRPVGPRRRPGFRQAGQRGGDLVERQPDVASGSDERQPTQYAALVTALAARCPGGRHEALRLVESQGRRRESASP